MTKQEYFDALVADGVNVAPIEKWQKITDPVREALNRIRYDVFYYANDLRVYKIDVENDNAAEENIVRMDYDPTAVVPEPEPTFTQRVGERIEEAKTNGTILAGFIKENNNVNSAIVLAVMPDNTQSDVLVKLEADDTLSLTVL
jgi:hypothetical protein